LHNATRQKSSKIAGKKGALRNIFLEPAFISIVMRG